MRDDQQEDRENVERLLDRVSPSVRIVVADCAAEFHMTGQRSALNKKRIFESFLEFLNDKARG
jgi:hypothetical protein